MINLNEILNLKTICNKPWGAYFDFYRSKTTCIKILIIKPGQKISYQRHFKRRETWEILEGNGRLILNDKEYSISAGNNFDVMSEDWHQVINVGEANLVCLEIQVGFPDEEDIERK